MNWKSMAGVLLIFFGQLVMFTGHLKAALAIILAGFALCTVWFLEYAEAERKKWHRQRGWADYITYVVIATVGLGGVAALFFG
jgi:hypothetical protein